MRRYESVIILDPEMPEEEIQGFTEKFSGLIKTGGGEIIKIEDWGAKRLAYPVKKRDKGRYLLLDFVGLPALIAELERQFKITDEVMKFLSVKVEDEVDLGAFRTSSEEPTSVAAEGQESVLPAEESPETVPEVDVSAQEKAQHAITVEESAETPDTSVDPIAHGPEGDSTQV